MDLEVLNLHVKADAVERATRDLKDLDIALDKVDIAALKLSDTNKILRGELINVASKTIGVSDSLTKSQAGFIATMKAAGASVKEIKFFSSQFENMNKIMGLNTFDKSANALARMRKQTEELTKSMKYIEKYNDLTKQQISLLTQGIEATRQRAISEGKNFGEREAAVKRFIKDFVKEAQSYNQVTSAIEEKNRVAREEIRLQQEQARAAQVSAKQRADAERYVQETLQKTLFMNEQMEKGKKQSAAAAMYEYKQRIDLLGLSADQAAAKMQEFETALDVRKSLRGTTEEVNHLARAVGVQLGDVFVSLAGGMNPFLVMIQQGDQMRFALDQAKASGQSLDKVMQGAFVNIANSFKMVGGIVKDFVIDAFSSAGNIFVDFSSAVVDAVGSLIGISDAMAKFSERLEQGAASGNLFYVSLQKILTALKTLAGGLLIGIAVTIGSLVFAMSRLDSLQSDLAKSINLYGAGLGITTKQALEMAVASDKNTAAMVTSISAIAKAGGFTKDQMKTVSETAVEMQKTFGIAVADTVAKFVELRKDPVDALLELQVQTGNVSKKVIENVKELVKQGKTYKAVEDAMNEYARASSETSNQVKDDLGAQATAIIAIKGQWADFWGYFQSLANEAVLRVSTSMTLISKVIGGTAAALASLASGNKVGASRIMDMIRFDEAKLRLNLDLALGGDGSEQLVEFSNTLKEAQADFEELKQEASNKSLFGPSGEDVADARLRVERLQQYYRDLTAVVTSSSEESVTAEQAAASERARIEKDNADLIKSGISDYEKYQQRIGEIDEQISKARAAGVDDNTIAAMLRGRQKVVDDYRKSVESAGKEAAKTQKYFDKLMEGASDLALNTRQEFSKLNSGYEQMTDSQKMLFDAQNDPRWNSLTERQKTEFENTLKLIEANEELIQQYKAQAALQEVLSKWADDYDSAATSIKEEVDALQLRNDLLFKTEDEAKAIQRQYDLNVKLAAVENKYIERRNQMMRDYVDLVKEGKWSPEALAEYQRNMAAVNQQEAQERDLAHKDANTAIVEDYEKKFKEIQGTVTDIIATAMFEGGKAGSKKLKDVLKQSFRNYVIDVFINPIVGSIMGSVTGGAGMSGQPSGGVTGLISNASSAYNLATGSTVAGISSAVQGAGALLGSSAVSSFGAGMTMTGTQVAALSEAGLVASKGAASLGSTFGAVMPWIAGGLLVADLLGVFDKKPSDKSSWATVDPTTGMVSDIGSMTGKKDPGQEQRDATSQLAAVIGQFAGMAGITSNLVTMLGQRDGIRVSIVDGWKTPSVGVANGSDSNMLVYGGIGDVEGALTKMLDDLVDEGTLNQDTIDAWRGMKQEIDGTARTSGELISVLNLLTAGYGEMDIERANLLQTEGEALEQAYARMLNIENALSGVIGTENTFTAASRGLAIEFERLGLTIPTSTKMLGDVVFGLDTTSVEGQSLYKTLMELAPAFLEVEAAFESNYDLLLSEQELFDKNLYDLSQTFSAIGVVTPNSTQELRSMIDTIDMTSSSSVELKAQLLSLVPAAVELEEQFIELNGAVEDLSFTYEEAVDLYNQTKNAQMSINDAVNQRLELEKRYFDATATAADIANKARSEIHEFNLEFYDMVVAAEDAKKAAEELAAEQKRIADERYSLETKLLQALGGTQTLRQREIEAIDESNRALQFHIWALEDLSSAQARYDASLSGVEAAEANIESIRDRATSNYLASLTGVESLQKSIADEARQTANAFADVAKSLREYLSDFEEPAKRFADVLKAALSGDAEAMRQLPSVAGGAIESSKLGAGSLVDFQREQSKILIGVEQAAILAESKAIAEAEEQKSLQEQLIDAQRESVEAAKVANAIGASLVAKQDSLIEEYKVAQENLTKALIERDEAYAELEEAKRILQDIEKNTGLTVDAVNSLQFQIDAAEIEARLAIDAVVNSKVIETLPEATRLLVLGTADNLTRTIKAIIQDTGLPENLKLIGIGVIGNVVKQVDVILKNPEITDNLKAIGIGQLNDVTEYINTVIKDVSIPNEVKDLILSSAAKPYTTATSLLVNLSSALTPDQRLVLEQAQETITKTVNTAVSGGAVTDTQKAILHAADETITKTANAVATGGSLTDNQRKILDAVTGTTSISASVSLENKLAADGGMLAYSKADVKWVYDKMVENTGLTATRLNNAEWYLSYLKTYLPNISDKLNGIQYETLQIAKRSLGEGGGIYVRYARGDRAGQNVYATGGAFTNGIVQRPTLFNESLMGEAGPEAIMPLTDIGGSLGVRAAMPSNDELVDELRAMRGELAELKASSQATARNTYFSRKQLERWDGDGLPETRDMLGETDVVL